jgi:hypothetical protein
MCRVLCLNGKDFFLGEIFVCSGRIPRDLILSLLPIFFCMYILSCMEHLCIYGPWAPDLQYWVSFSSLGETTLGGQWRTVRGLKYENIVHQILRYLKTIYTVILNFICAHACAFPKHNCCTL